MGACTLDLASTLRHHNPIQATSTRKTMDDYQWSGWGRSGRGEGGVAISGGGGGGEEVNPSLSTKI